MQGRSFKELLNEAIAIFKKNISIFLMLTLFVFIPISIARVFADKIIDIQLIEEYLANIESFVDTTDHDKLAVISAISKQLSMYFVVTFIISLFALAGDIVIIKITLSGQNKTFFEIFEESLKQFPKVLWTFLIANILIAFGLLLILPGLFMYFLFAFTIQVVVIHNFRGLKAIRYAMVVARKNLLRVVGYSIFSIAAGLVVAFITSLLFNFVQIDSLSNILSVIKLSVDSLIMCIPTILFTLVFLEMQKQVDENINILFSQDYSTDQS